MTYAFKSPEVAGITKGLVFWYKMAIRIKAALKQSYLDNGCREEEATEMSNAFFITADHDGPTTDG